MMIRLETFCETDYDQLISWVDSAETLMQFGGPQFIFPLTHAQLKQCVAENRIAFKVVEVQSLLTIGHAQIYLDNRSAWLNRIIIGNPNFRNLGFGKFIVQQLLEYIFLTLDREVAELNVFDSNVAAIRCYERSGFTISQQHKVVRSVNGKTWNAHRMILDKNKWQKIYKPNE